jgi:hypothetical protein
VWRKGIVPQAVRRRIYGLNDSIRLQVARRRFQKPPDWCRRVAFSVNEDWAPKILEGFAHWPIEIVFARPADLILDNFDLVVPLNIDDALWLANRPELNFHNPIAVPRADVIRLCDDKKASLDLLASAGFRSHLALGAAPTYPYILKRRRGEASIGTHIVQCVSDEELLRSLLDDPDYCTQRFIPGCREYCTHIHFDSGTVISELTVEYTFATEQPIKFQDQPLYTRYMRCPDLPVLTAMLRTLAYNGLCNFNYKVYKGKVIVFELNPRMGASLCPLFFTFVGAIPYLKRQFLS